jgi:hypothetical protein
LLRNIPKIGDPLIGDDGGIVDAGGGELGLTVLRRSLLVSVGEEHRHLNAESVPGRPDFCRKLVML